MEGSCPFWSLSLIQQASQGTNVLLTSRPLISNLTTGIMFYLFGLRQEPFKPQGKNPREFLKSCLLITIYILRIYCLFTQLP